jgi:hypothetical protein
MQVCGKADVWGDGIVPVPAAHLPGAQQITINGAYHSPLGAAEVSRHDLYCRMPAKCSDAAILRQGAAPEGLCPLVCKSALDSALKEVIAVGAYVVWGRGALAKMDRALGRCLMDVSRMEALVAMCLRLAEAGQLLGAITDDRSKSLTASLICKSSCLSKGQ